MTGRQTQRVKERERGRGEGEGRGDSYLGIHSFFLEEREVELDPCGEGKG